MAILKKRTSSKQLPEARGLDRAPLGSIIRGVDDSPSLTGRGSSSVTSAGGSGGSNTVQSQAPSGRPFTSTFTNPATTKPTLTTKTSSTPKTTLAPKTSLTTNTSNAPKTSLAPKTTLTSSTTPTTKPTITNKTSTTPTTKTTTGTNTVKPTVKPNVSNPNSTTNKVVNALTGAAIGAGTKLLVDKITGKPTASDKTKPPGGTANPPSGTANRPSGTARPPASGTNRPAGSTTSVVKPPVINPSTGKPSGTGFGDDPEEYTTDSLGNVFKTMPDGTSVLYRAAEVEDEFPSSGTGTGATVSGLESLAPGETMVNDNGTTVTALDDGNGGVMYVYGGYDKETGLGPKGGGTRGLGGDSADSGDASDTIVAGGDTQYFQDDEGNYYTINDDGGYDLAYYADGSVYSDDYTVDGGDAYADNTYYDDQTGATWTMADNGEWTTDFNWDDYYGNDYSLYADSDYAVNNDNSAYYDDYSDYSDYTDYADYTDYSDYEYAKRGGLITMMKQGGVAHMADGGYMPDGAVDNGDGTYTIGRFTYDMMTDEYLYSMDDGQITNVNSDAIYSSTPEDDYYSTDSLGNVFKNGEFYRAAEVDEDITSAGGGNRAWYNDLGNLLNKGYTSATGLGKTALEGITGALGTTAGAAGAGALIATLLGQDFGGGTGNQNQGLDMSKVGLINPRTTDFGIGPTNFVGYEDYGTSDGDYTPNAELLKNLNAPGYNPVNEGDYGYEEVAADEAESTPKMASGGLSSMSTPVASYYTFGQPADILANLGMRPQPPMNPPEMMPQAGQQQTPQIGQQQPPQQAQQQGLPQQMPPQMMQQAPQGMPQQGIMPQQQGMPPPMRKGGLPRASDVPIVEGRMDFRKGSAVHGPGDGQSDDIPAMLADGEYVIDAETVAQIGNGSTKAGAQALDKFRESIRSHKRSAPVNKIPPKTKALTSYLKG